MQWNWLTVGRWGLRCRLLQKFSHRLTGILYDDRVLTLHDALMIWATSGDSPAVGRCLTKLLLPDWTDPRFGVVSLFLVAGAGVDELVSIVVLSLVSPTAQIVGTTAVFAYRKLSPRLSPNPVQVWLAHFIYMIYIWVRFAWCILRTFATSKQIYFWFPKLIKMGLNNPLI